ncbi:fibronectin type III domain-containing protein [Streptacidiphilus carbonis]|uniref:fibronectin type III domain-containing protein n=1 Tax=Streptacidiphilus carbonis TaxID=105422 RepID=UPI0007C6D0A7|nr:fibronectin type III domain-containing protein [Streptacidiphilus carbonis]
MFRSRSAPGAGARLAAGLLATSGLLLGGAALPDPAAAAAAATSTTAGTAAHSATMATFYVSPSGDDRSTGTTPAQAVRTPQRAQQLVRAVDGTMTGDVQVVLANGTYRLDQPLTLDARDSGSNGHRVLWTAAPGATPVLSGGQRVSGWRQTAPGSTIWSAPVPAGLDTRQLYVNGVRAQRASGPVPVALTATATGYTASADTLAHWRNPSDIEFVYTGGDGMWSLRTGGQGSWTEPRCPIASVSGTTITMAQPCWDNSNKRVMRTDNSGRTVNLVGPESLGNSERPAYVENAYELLTQPGQWYLDRTAHTVYYIPRAGEKLTQADVEAPVLQTLVSGQGTAAAPVHDIGFTGIQFSYATWLTPSTPEGFSEIQADYTVTGATGYATQGLCQFIAGGTCPYGDWTQLPGNVSFSHDTGISFERDAFEHLGAAGLALGDGTHDATVRGSVFTDISGNGLELGGVDQPTATGADQTDGNRILDNHLYSLPVEYHGGVAIDVGYAADTLISHNQIDHTAYTGISLGWGGWPDKIGQAATANFSHDNTVSDNLITDPMQVLSDGGGIYTQGITGPTLASGEHLTGNVITGALGHGHTLYCDNGCTNWTADGNVLVGNENDWGARHTDYRPGATGDDPLAITGNYWQQGDADSSSKNVTVAGNHVIASIAQAPKAITSAAGIEPAYRDVLGARTPAGVPEPPTQTAAFATDGSAHVDWNPSMVDHGAAVASYTVTAQPGGEHVTVTAAQFQVPGYAVLSGLTDGTAYTFTVTARNAHGDSAASLPTAPVTPAVRTAAVPGVPTAVAAKPGDGTAGLSWNPPASVGSSPVTGYTVRTPGRAPVHVTGHTYLWATSSRNIFTVLGGLSNARSYTFQITADNAAGSSAPVGVTVVPGPTTACTGAALTLTPTGQLAAPGSTVTVAGTLSNGCGSALTGAQLTLIAPTGYTVGNTAHRLGRLAAGATANAAWKVTVPADATGSGQLLVLAQFDQGGQHQGLRATSQVAVPAASLAAAFDNVGVTDDSATAAGNLDGSGSSYSAQALAAAGVTPGTALSHGGVSFSWPGAASGRPDNVVAQGQPIDLTGSGTTLGFLAAGTSGAGAGTGEIVYTDGSTQSYTVTVPDWYATPPAGSDVAIATAYRNRAGNVQQVHATNVYYTGVPLTAGKTVAMVVLPAPTPASGALHVFALAVS